MAQATKAQIEDMKMLAAESLKFLCQNILWKDNEEYRSSWGPVHDDMRTMLRRPSRRKLILVPRGHLKSAIITKAYTVQCLLKNPNCRVLIANQVWDKSREMLMEIKEYLTNKSDLRHLFGTFQSDRWNQDEIVIKQRTRALSAPSVGTTGVESEMTSTHYDVIIGDDLQGLNNCQTRDQREKVKRFYRSLLDLLEPQGQLIIVGTRWHQDDLYADILEKEKDFYDVMVRRVIQDGKILFPRKFSLNLSPRTKSWEYVNDKSMDFINYLKKSKGSEFYSQYMNNPVDEENQIFKRDSFKYFTDRPRNLYVGMTVDLAISQKEEADYTAIVVCGMDWNHNVYVLDYLRGHWAPSQTVKNLFDMQAKWLPHTVGMEVNGFQRTLKYSCEDEMRRRRRYFPIEEIQTSNRVTKEYRIKALEPLYREKMVHHAAWMQGRDLEDELLTFPKGKNEDLIDALSMQLNILAPGGKETPEQEPVGSFGYYQKQIIRQQTLNKDFFCNG